MKQVRWFDRKFNFDYTQNIFPAIIERLGGTPIRLSNKISYIPEDILSSKIGDRWSIKENVGHLIDLEPLWQGRLEDIIQGQETMREADLSNTKTYEANHNSRDIEDLLQEFDTIRSKTLEQLIELDEEVVFASSIHPRLKKPMRTMDLFLFVAEHDDQHLAQMTELYLELTDE